MTGDLSDLVLETEYRTGETPDPVTGFYVPCFKAATRYDRAVGYFRSSVMVVAGPSVIDFVKRGGHIRLIASPSLSAEDIAALSTGYEQRQKRLDAAVLRDVELLLETPELRHPTELVATLVAIGALELRIAVRKDGHGIFHEKLGIFTDAPGNMVSFRGSSNETWSAWHELGNLESFDVFTSWPGGSDSTRVEKHRAYFDRLWGSTVPGVDVLPFPAAARMKLCSVARPSLEDLEPPTPGLDSQVREPLPHQVEAVSAWELAGFRGILEHATGSGKTYTALLAIRSHVQAGHIAMVLVPSVLLHEQWRTELRNEIAGVVILEAGAGKNAWQQDGRLASFASPITGQPPRVILATMSTASSERFLAALTKVDNLLLVADEVHQTGSVRNRRLFGINAAKRLGLSATPRRAGDEEGTKALLEYFGGILYPPFTLAAAIAAGRLVQYEYFPHFVDLTNDEVAEWAKITSELVRDVARANRNDLGLPQITERVKLLLIQRSRIVKKAQAKVHCACDILKTHYEPGQRWLVYCEDITQMDAVGDALASAGITTHEYHSSMHGNQGSTLDWFVKFGGVLLAVRCLDEGVDIPAISHALILASSQNPRQFIQRRGRVLRKAPGKYLARVHDTLVLPPESPDGPSMLSVARAELVRAIEFASTALNPIASVLLRERAMEVGVDLAELTSLSVEEDDQDE